MGDEFARRRLEQRIAGGVTVPIIDCLEAVEVDIDKRGRGAVALHVSERALEIAFSAAAIEDIEQRVDVGARLEFGNPGAGGGPVRP